ncbi:MAG: lysostaphin resistance A-like protein [Planctomycetia bacterium]
MLSVPALGLGAMAAAVAGSLWMLALIGARFRRGEPLVRQGASEPVAWDGMDVLWIVVVAILLQSVAVSLGPKPLPVRQQLTSGMLATAAAAALAVVHLRRRGASWQGLGLRVADWPAALRQAVGTVALVLAPLLGLAAVLDRIEPYRHPIVDFLAEHRDAASLALVWLAACVVAPIVEELFFRRILQGWLEQQLTPSLGAAQAGGLAIAGAAALFAAAHVGQGLAWVPLVGLGIVLGVLARQTGSIVPGILAHALFNAVSIVLVLMQPAT